MSPATRKTRAYAPKLDPDAADEQRSGIVPMPAEFTYFLDDCVTFFDVLIQLSKKVLWAGGFQSPI
jgi:hypothetical protein